MSEEKACYHVTQRQWSEFVKQVEAITSTWDAVAKEASMRAVRMSNTDVTDPEEALRALRNAAEDIVRMETAHSIRSSFLRCAAEMLKSAKY